MPTGLCQNSFPQSVADSTLKNLLKVLINHFIWQVAVITWIFCRDASSLHKEKWSLNDPSVDCFVKFNKFRKGSHPQHRYQFCQCVLLMPSSCIKAITSGNLLSFCSIIAMSLKCVQT